MKMKQLGALALAAVAALAVIAIAGATTASAADVLCEENVTPCPAAKKVAVNGLIKWEALNPKFTGPPAIQCEKSTYTEKITKNNGIENPTGEITAWTWTNCKNLDKGTGCMVLTRGLPFHVEWVTVPEVAQTIKGATSGSPRFEVTCGESPCTYSSSHLTGTFDPGAPAKITFGDYPLTGAGVSCAAVGKLDAVFVAEAPTSSLFLTTS
jgi:hypothetical protein